MSTLQNLTPYADILLAQAREYLGKHEDNLAIILAHTACEIETEVSLTCWIQSRGRAGPRQGDLLWETVGVPMHLEAKRVYRIYSTLASDYPKGHTDLRLAAANWWDQWKGSLKVRRAVAYTS